MSVSSCTVTAGRFIMQTAYSCLELSICSPAVTRRTFLTTTAHRRRRRVRRIPRDTSFHTAGTFYETRRPDVDSKIPIIKRSVIVRVSKATIFCHFVAKENSFFLSAAKLFHLNIKTVHFFLSPILADISARNTCLFFERIQKNKNPVLKSSYGN